MFNYFFGNDSKEEESSSEVSADESMESSLSESSADESMKEGLNSESSDNEALAIEDVKMEDANSKSNDDNGSVEEMKQPHNDKDAIERYGIPACYYILSRNTIAAENATQSAITAAEQKQFKDVTINYFNAFLEEGKNSLAKQEENKQLALAEAEHYLNIIEQYRGALIAEGAMKHKRETNDDNDRPLKRTRIIEPLQEIVVASTEDSAKRKKETESDRSAKRSKKDDKHEKKRSEKREGKRKETKEEKHEKKRRKMG